VQTTATRQDSKQATDTDVPREPTRASTTFGFTRRRFCGVAAATISAGLLDIHGFCRRDEAMTDGMAGVAQQTGRNNSDIRPFHVNVPEAELTELRRRINSTRWPDRETVTDESAVPAKCWCIEKANAVEPQWWARPRIRAHTSL
jgi:hypothetical protein